MDLTWIKADYPFEQSHYEKFNVIFSLSIFASFIVVILQPFGFIPFHQTQYFLGYLGIAIIVLSINYFGLPYYFPIVFEESRWSVLKAFLFLLYNFIIIGLWDHIFDELYIRNKEVHELSEMNFSSILFKTIAIGIITSFFLILLKYNFITRKHLQISQDLNSNLKNQIQQLLPIKKSEVIDLKLDNQKISIERRNLSYVSADGNYITLHFSAPTNKTPKVLRATMKEVEDLLSEYPEFFRCHRSFIINLNAIESSIGNSQGLYVKVNNDEKIPVARSKIKALRQFLKNANSL